jgi:hypothetical protein
MASWAEVPPSGSFLLGARGSKLRLARVFPWRHLPRTPGETTARKMRGITAALGTDDFPPRINRPQPNQVAIHPPSTL